MSPNVRSRPAALLVLLAALGGTAITHEVDLSQRRIGPWNLGGFGAMVQRHRPVPVADAGTRP